MTCATVGCEYHSVGKSKYCRLHRDAAREAWLSRVREGAEARQIRDEKHAALWLSAVTAAHKAHEAAIPTPMVVTEEVPATGRQWFVSEGACGFGYVTIHPANSSFALWVAKHTSAHKSYRGGLRFGTNFGSQSVARAEAAAYALADVLREAGIRAYAGSNLD